MVAVPQTSEERKKFALDYVKKESFHGAAITNRAEAIVNEVVTQVTRNNDWDIKDALVALKDRYEATKDYNEHLAVRDAMAAMLLWDELYTHRNDPKGYNVPDIDALRNTAYVNSVQYTQERDALAAEKKMPPRQRAIHEINREQKLGLSEKDMRAVEIYMKEKLADVANSPSLDLKQTILTDDIEKSTGKVVVDVRLFGNLRVSPGDLSAMLAREDEIVNGKQQAAPEKTTTPAEPAKDEKSSVAKKEQKKEVTPQQNTPTAPQVTSPATPVTGGNATTNDECIVQAGQGLSHVAALQTELLEVAKQQFGKEVSDRDVKLGLALIIAKKNGIEKVDEVAVGAHLVMPTKEDIIAAAKFMNAAGGVLNDDHKLGWNRQHTGEIQTQAVSKIVGESVKTVEGKGR